jgi:hypothetical protein
LDGLISLPAGPSAREEEGLRVGLLALKVAQQQRDRVGPWHCRRAGLHGCGLHGQVGSSRLGEDGPDLGFRAKAHLALPNSWVDDDAGGAWVPWMSDGER